MDQSEKLSRSYDLAAELMANPLAPWDFWKNCYRYAVDFA
jgi:hypothetical protein